MTLGEVAEASGDAEQSVTCADRSGDAFQRMVNRTTHADALHQAGRRAEAETRFREAEQMQQERQPAYSLLYSVRGFKYCDLLLAAPERAAWQICLGSAGVPPAAFGVSPKASAAQDQSAGTPTGSDRDGRAPLIESCRAVSQRAAQTLKIAERNNWLLDIALDHLTLGRAALYAAILQSFRRGELREPPSSAEKSGARGTRPSDFEVARRELDAAVAGLRRAGTTHHIPRGLLSRAWLRYLTGARTGPESAQAHLDEAWEIAERGPMRLFLADILLYRARLFGGVWKVISNQGSVNSDQKYPWGSAAADLAAAEQLIRKCGYHRRDEELADARKAIPGR